MVYINKINKHTRKKNYHTKKHEIPEFELNVYIYLVLWQHMIYTTLDLIIRGFYTRMMTKWSKEEAIGLQITL
jgi:hypothetical protein